VIKNRTEQEWIYDYVQNKKDPLPLVLGTKGTWTGNGKPMIILIGFTLIDVLVMGDIYGVSHHPVRKMEYRGLTYYAINLIEKKQVKEIIKEWSQQLS
jgi:CO dehydrogenase/acetyl-CoA synthase alpha subunit